jgi:hypothetical protein
MNEHNITNGNIMLKIGRNDPCHCGSGKKYKKCCMNKGSRAKVGRYALMPEAKAVGLKERRDLKAPKMLPDSPIGLCSFSTMASASCNGVALET